MKHRFSFVERHTGFAFSAEEKESDAKKNAQQFSEYNSVCDMNSFDSESD